MIRVKHTAAACVSLLLLLPAPEPAAAHAQAAPTQADSRADRISLRIDTSEAEAVLAVLAQRRTGASVTAEAWERVVRSEPYRRLKQRESDMQRAFTDEEFRAFVESDELAAREDALRRTLAAWSAADLETSARAVLSYLPAEARIRATVYPVIKPRSNSFVYDLAGDPAIFLYLDPDVTGARFENTVLHELHHVGLASLPDGGSAAAAPDASPALRHALRWLGAFGEGTAMLAAAGGPDTHPHAASEAAVRARWDADLAHVARDLRAIEQFFLDVLEGRLVDDAAVRERAFSFFGEQGPWYTVGYTWPPPSSVISGAPSWSIPCSTRGGSCCGTTRPSSPERPAAAPPGRSACSRASARYPVDARHGGLAHRRRAAR